MRRIGIEFTLRNYLTHPLSEKEILILISLLELKNPEDLMRQPFNEKLKDIDQSSKYKRIAKTIAAAPELLQRPVVITKGKAIIARPPSLAVEFIEKSLSY